MIKDITFLSPTTFSVNFVIKSPDFLSTGLCESHAIEILSYLSKDSVSLGVTSSNPFIPVSLSTDKDNLILIFSNPLKEKSVPDSLLCLVSTVCSLYLRKDYKQVESNLKSFISVWASMSLEFPSARLEVKMSKENGLFILNVLT